MDSKNIKDYLHLYLGCDCQRMGQTNDSELFRLTGISWDGTQKIWWAYFEDKEDCYSVIDDVFPILRPLSDMTEEEKKGLIKYDKLVQNYNSVKFHDELANDKLVGIVIQYSHTVDEGDWAWECPQTWVLRFSSMNAHDFMWLLAKGFDLFGLIDAGLAIKKSD